MNTEDRALVLVSGGMDSVTALYDAAVERPLAGVVSFDYGSKHNHRELPFAAWHASNLGLPHWVIPLAFIGHYFQSSLLQGGASLPHGHYTDLSMKSTVVPFRNGIMLAVAGGLAESVGASSLVIAAHSGDHAIYPDCREPFMLAMETALKEGTYAGITLLRPFIHMDKTAIVKRGRLLGIDYAQTWSCYEGGEVHCGKCGTCHERKEAFTLAGFPDPTVYSP
jgi:7-cyano-7-deazaguanine synthase